MDPALLSYMLEAAGGDDDMKFQILPLLPVEEEAGASSSPSRSLLASRGARGQFWQAAKHIAT